MMDFRKQMNSIKKTRPSVSKVNNDAGGEMAIFKTSFSSEYPDIVITHAGRPCTQRDFHKALNNTVPAVQEYHAHDCFFLVYVNKGQNIEFVEGQKLLVTEDDLLLLTPHTLHYNLHTSDCELAFIHINPSVTYKYMLPMLSQNVLFSHFFSEYLTDQSIKKVLFFPDCMHELRPVLLSIINEYVEKPPLYNAMIISLLNVVILELARMSTFSYSDFSSAGGSQLQDILAYIAENYRTITLSSTAEKFGYHPAYLSALIKKKAGISFRDLITDYKLTQACLFLKEQKMSVEQIAYACGYQEMSTFYRTFIKQYHCSPGDWRKAHEDHQ